MKAFINGMFYLIVLIAIGVLLIYLWQMLWDLVMPLFGLPVITFAQSAAMWGMATMITGWVLIFPKLAK